MEEPYTHDFVIRKINDGYHIVFQEMQVRVLIENDNCEFKIFLDFWSKLRFGNSSFDNFHILKEYHHLGEYYLEISYKETIVCSYGVYHGLEPKISYFLKKTDDKKLGENILFYLKLLFLS